ncbi:predicted protein [Histoplasma mississippiense (nom. inval.)]|uniref:predicted protein n=1 Tax=Ajellomyces capsulatus (strain NAm1 / WU24) TaxID=2059318 RepID=UPI000157B81A|nr:predicted protein [Histoplasma mississippiense (nom. inval.)]EDN03715.1 predicted protein [Histoplasma mississippiense (nom. inval.)]
MPTNLHAIREKWIQRALQSKEEIKGVGNNLRLVGIPPPHAQDILVKVGILVQEMPVKECLAHDIGTG